MRNLMQQRDEMEKEISNLGKQVHQIETAGIHNSYSVFIFIIKEGFDKPLVDREGFPRQDIDFGRLSEYRLMKKKFNGICTSNNDILFIYNIRNAKRSSKIDERDRRRFPYLKWLIILFL